MVLLLCDAGALLAALLVVLALELLMVKLMQLVVQLVVRVLLLALRVPPPPPPPPPHQEPGPEAAFVGGKASVVWPIIAETEHRGAMRVHQRGEDMQHG